MEVTLHERGRAHHDIDEWELYDLQADRSETDNLAAQFPERVTAMARDLGAPESFDLRRPAMQWMDLQTAQKEALDTVAGVGVSKLIDAGNALAGQGDPAAIRRSIPLNQLAPVSALIKAWQEGTTNDN